MYIRETHVNADCPNDTLYFKKKNAQIDRGISRCMTYRWVNANKLLTHWSYVFFSSNPSIWKIQ